MYRLGLVEGPEAYTKMKVAFEKENIPELVARVSNIQKKDKDRREAKGRRCLVGMYGYVKAALTI